MTMIGLPSAFAAVFMIAGTTLAQSPEITSFCGDGQLTWTNGDTNLFYRIEWAPSLTAPTPWQSNFCALTDIRSSASVVTSSVPMFYRVCGSSNRVVFASPVPKTGQTNSYAAGDDGAYQRGVAWPKPRFTAQTDTNCILDNLTGLIWARSANLAGVMAWSSAINYCESLTYGGTNDWRLPNRKELDSLVDLGRYNLALPSGHPFAGVQPSFYWSSSTHADGTDRPWFVDLGWGGVGLSPKTTPYYVWPVRGGR